MNNTLKIGLLALLTMVSINAINTAEIKNTLIASETFRVPTKAEMMKGEPVGVVIEFIKAIQLDYEKVNRDLSSKADGNSRAFLSLMTDAEKKSFWNSMKRKFSSYKSATWCDLDKPISMKVKTSDPDLVIVFMSFSVKEEFRKDGTTRCTNVCENYYIKKVGSNWLLCDCHKEIPKGVKK